MRKFKTSRKMKKIFAGILATTMVMSTMTLSGFAVDETTTDTIDTNKAVSLTIHKYEYSGNDGVAGTGSANDTVPADAAALEGVEFTVYKVADIIQETDQAGALVGIKYQTTAELKTAGVSEYIDGGMSADTVNSTFITNATVKAALDASGTKVSKTTGADGIAKFANSDLAGQGLYLVVESAKPDKVTSEMAPFLVSLPTTIQQANDSGWLYDVHAFPKNDTTVSGITIRKVGKVANSSAIESVNGATFKLQKYDTATGKWVTQTKNANNGDIGTAGIITVPVAGIAISDLAPGKYRLVELSAPTGYIVDSDKTYEFDIATDGTVSTTDDDTSLAGTTITVTNDKPEVEKEVLKKNGTASNEADWSDKSDYSVGDTVTFKITASVPSNVDKLKTFKLVDTFDANKFTVDADSFRYVFYTGEDSGLTVNDAVLVPESSLTINGNTGWTLDLSDSAIRTALKANNITTIEVLFNATLTSDAVTAGDGNVNTIGLEFTNKIYPTTDDTDDPVTPPSDVKEETTTITDKVVVYTFGLQLNKTFKDGTASATVNATFDLYEKLADDAMGEDVVTLPGNSNIKVKKIGTYTTDANGKIILNTNQTGDNDKAFSNGTYYFVETKTADGYNLLKEPVKVELQKYYERTFQTTTTTTKYDADGNVIPTPVVTTTGTDKTTYYSDANHNNEIADEDLVTSVNVENRKGFSFPVTGGTGTIIFTVAGLVLMIGAIFVFFASKKRKCN